MMKATKYKNMREFLRKNLNNRQEYVIVKYDYQAGQKVRAHYHLDAGHWIVFAFGKFEFHYDKKLQEIVEPVEGVSAVYIKPDHVHKVVCLTDGCYFVVRESKTETIYLE